MKLCSLLAFLQHLTETLQVALLPTLKEIWRTPSLLRRPRALSRVYMSYLWIPMGEGVDQGGREVKQSLIPLNARGVVLDLGAGHGHTMDYLNRDLVTKFVALEPNQLMHDRIRERAATAGYTESAGTLLILPYGAEDISAIVSALGGPHSVDTLISVLTLCSVPSPEDTLQGLVELVLKPGGTFLFYEHVLSPRDDVAWWQRFWTPIWSRLCDGCRLDRPTHVYVRKMGAWSTGRVWGKEGEEEENLFWHQVGIFTKAV
ncbi:hypothetical protein WOLCODRAFT_106332 [Wolfiporia cocos MD-104 SS10]|uniref:S-adenosyl-L-methionine-dependent methyltransferase n=1 Tax=Wolfiporia cocos (strain MD-104) TaxID=742152 RepID=A0A2H3IXB7_WOLCO|nr:hypothetical protein WOLCODRAFT_106332 [Wolfiporia cocos MD-104 SS10]